MRKTECKQNLLQIAVKVFAFDFEPSAAFFIIGAEFFDAIPEKNGVVFMD